jgi:hypothetical protein
MEFLRTTSMALALDPTTLWVFDGPPTRTEEIPRESVSQTQLDRS